MGQSSCVPRDWSPFCRQQLSIPLQYHNKITNSKAMIFALDISCWWFLYQISNMFAFPATVKARITEAAVLNDLFLGTIYIYSYIYLHIYLRTCSGTGMWSGFLWVRRMVLPSSTMLNERPFCLVAPWWQQVCSFNSFYSLVQINVNKAFSLTANTRIRVGVGVMTVFRLC